MGQYSKGGAYKVKFSKKIVSLIIAANIIFTIAILYVFLQVGTEPYALVGAFFGFTTVELWSLASIKKTEAKNEQYIETLIEHEDTKGE